MQMSRTNHIIIVPNSRESWRFKGTMSSFKREHMQFPFTVNPSIVAQGVALFFFPFNFFFRQFISVMTGTSTTLTEWGTSSNGLQADSVLSVMNR